eukprot:1151234-Pelagomonas_calceolata.AAC.10
MAPAPRDCAAPGDEDGGIPQMGQGNGSGNGSQGTVQHLGMRMEEFHKWGRQMGVGMAAAPGDCAAKTIL